MTRKPKKHAKAIARILDAETREIVGYLYKWNTGEVDPKWIDDIQRAKEDVIYEYA